MDTSQDLPQRKCASPLYRRIVGLIQIAGALFFFLVSLPQTTLTGRGGAVLLVLFGFVFLAALVGGVLLLLNKPWGILLSLAVQGLQLVRVASDSVLYMLIIGPEITLGFARSPTGDLLLNYAGSFRGAFFLYLLEAGSQDVSLRLQHENGLFNGINLVALASFLILLCAMKHASRPKQPGA